MDPVPNPQLDVRLQPGRAAQSRAACGLATGAEASSGSSPSLEFAWASALPAASTARTSRRSRHIAAGPEARGPGARRPGRCYPGAPARTAVARRSPRVHLWPQPRRARASGTTGASVPSWPLRARASCRSSGASGAPGLPGPQSSFCVFLLPSFPFPSFSFLHFSFLSFYFFFIFF